MNFSTHILTYIPCYLLHISSHSIFSDTFRYRLDFTTSYVLLCLLLGNSVVSSRVRWFRQKNFRFKAKRSETRSISHAFRTLMRKKKIFRIFSLRIFASDPFARFASDLFVSLQSETKETFFRLISFSFRFRCEN